MEVQSEAPEKPAKIYMDRNLKDSLFLEYVDRLGFVFDVQKGIVIRKGRSIGSVLQRRQVTINFSLPDKTLTGITRARAIWLKVHGSVPSDKEVGHKSFDQTDDSIDNLELISHSDRQRKVIANGRSKLDPRSFAKLDVEKVNQLRKLSKQGWSLNKMAKEFGVSKITVLHAVNGKTWKDATEEPNIQPKKPSIKIVSVRKPKSSRPVSKYEQHVKILTSLLANNRNLSNESLMRFLHMRGLDMNLTTLRKTTSKIKSTLPEKKAA